MLEKKEKFCPFMSTNKTKVKCDPNCALATVAIIKETSEIVSVSCSLKNYDGISQAIAESIIQQ